MTQKEIEEKDSVDEYRQSIIDGCKIQPSVHFTDNHNNADIVFNMAFSDNGQAMAFMHEMSVRKNAIIGNVLPIRMKLINDRVIEVVGSFIDNDDLPKPKKVQKIKFGKLCHANVEHTTKAGSLECVSCKFAKSLNLEKGNVKCKWEDK